MGDLQRFESVCTARQGSSGLKFAINISANAFESEDLPTIPVGLFVQADIRGRKVDNVVRLPRSSLRDNNQVLVVDDNNRLQFRRVVILRLEHDDILVESGLEAGERVCVSPLQTVVEGMSVVPVDA